ncbi:flagellar biosynthesis protein FlgA [Micromonospora sp. WMMD987]|uniref:flagellar biosynthesis protein FlgA n=1 Tax=Micromonospora TaxID=1873 RepID=UPI00249AC4FA|nr:flagellar biosynthesis protein FlgA [Micromonospora sp. WMMD987]WFE96235.1 flagellar biosynthesis protein FlgA [Micromonospora sp. WMMD987]
MAAGGTDGEGSLRPFRWPRRPGGATLLRAVLVAALLGLAVLVLDTPARCPAGPPPPTVGPALPAGPAGATAQDGCVPPGPDDTARAGRPDHLPTGRAGAGDAAAPAGKDGDRDTPVALPLPSGFVGVPVRLAEPAALAVLRPGARVDLLVVPAGRAAGETILLAADALVLDVVGDGATDGSSALYLAVRPDQAQRSVGQPEGSRFGVVVRR